ncbi:MAG: hypothetical protein K8T89_20025 [Planctomycetes bacterium]|nr:hypothetical protein [Planctomycetota bacterium]
MWRLASLAIVAIAFASAEPAMAQPKGPPFGPRGGGEDTKKLKAELDKLQELLKDIEGRLKKSTEPAPKAEAKGPWSMPYGRGPGGFGPPGYGRGFTPPKAPAPSARGPVPMGSPWRDWGRGPSSSSSIENKLDRIIKELEEIRRDLSRRR